jgi:hypothetical protein
VEGLRGAEGRYAELLAVLTDSQWPTPRWPVYTFLAGAMVGHAATQGVCNLLKFVPFCDRGNFSFRIGHAHHVIWTILTRDMLCTTGMFAALCSLGMRKICLNSGSFTGVPIHVCILPRICVLLVALDRCMAYPPALNLLFLANILVKFLHINNVAKN